jgi:hypothetical protein
MEITHAYYHEGVWKMLPLSKMIPFEDQAKIEDLVWRNDQRITDPKWSLYNWKQVMLKDGLYSIPKTEGEIVEVSEDDSGIDGSGPPYSKVDFKRVFRIKPSPKIKSLWHTTYTETI